VTDLIANHPSELTAIRRQLVGRLEDRLDRSLDAKQALATLMDVTSGEFLLVGGSIRHALFNDSLSGDLDIILPNGDDRGFRAFDSLQIPFSYNSNGHRRYRWNGSQIDMFQPKEFFDGFSDEISTLQYFDLKVNSLGVQLKDGRVIDPFHLLERSNIHDPGINWTRWRKMNDGHRVVLAIRLVKILTELPHLELPQGDRDRLLDEVLPSITRSDWDSLKNRFPLGRDKFVPLFLEIINRNCRN
jgi:hypothetical protein